VKLLPFVLVATLAVASHAADTPQPAEPMQLFTAKLQATLRKHLTQLLGADGAVAPLKGKTAEGSEALTFYLMFERTGEQRYRKAAVSMADQVLKDMRAMKFGVLAIKEKEKSDGQTIMGGGAPALGNYAAGVAYILFKEGGRTNDLTYIATVIDRYPWNEAGWWAATIDVTTGEPKEPLTKPSPVNKSAAIAMAAGMVSVYVQATDPALAARLKQKADKCIYSQLIPAQLADGFWHYGLTGNDPGNKDILGYFMLTTEELMKLQQFNPAYREEKLNAAVRKAQAFALKHIAPMTEPNHGPACKEHATRETPAHYALKKDTKRCFQLGRILFGGGYTDEGLKIMHAALEQFPVGNGGQDGAHAAEPSALLLSSF
jgi:hypothetical protein